MQCELCVFTQNVNNPSKFDALKYEGRKQELVQFVGLRPHTNSVLYIIPFHLITWVFST